MNRVLVVGGGPAGLGVAIVLAQHNIPSLVIEKSTWPKDKVCGEGIMPTGVDFLSTYGISQKLPEDGFRAFKGICHFSENVVAQGEFHQKYGNGIRRTYLSSALLQRAQDFSCIEIMDYTKLNNFHVENDCVSIDITQRKTTIPVSEKFSVIIGADGIRSQVRKIAELEGTPPGRKTRWGGRQHFAIEPWSDYVEIRWTKGLESYVTPSGKKRVEVAFLWDRNLFKPNKQNWFQSMLDVFPDLKERLHGKESLSEPMGIGPLAVAAKKAISDRIILVGDANLYLDGITGEGISMAFHQAEILGKYLPPLLVKNTLSKQDFLPIQKEFLEITTTYVKITNLMLFFSRTPFVRKLVMRALSRSPKIHQHFLQANMGKKSFWNIPILYIWQLFYGILFPVKIKK